MSLNEESQTLVNLLIKELRVAIPRSYKELCEEFPDICGFAIATTPVLEFVDPIFQRGSELPVDVKEAGGILRFWPPEWKVMNQTERNDSFGENVQQAIKNINAYSEATDYEFDGDIGNAFWSGLLELLTELRSSGKLGEKNDEHYLTIWEAGSDEAMLYSASEQLNSPELHQRVLQMNQ
jgi:hypothetical protein